MVSSSHGCLFCWWLKPLPEERKAIWQFVMSESVCGAIRASPLLRPQTSVPTTMSSDPIDRSAESHFQQYAWHISIESPPVRPLSSHWRPLRKCINIMAREKKESLNVFCISRTFLLHNRSSFKVLQPVKCKLWASCLLCALTQCWYFKHYFKMYVCLKVILSTEHNYFLTDDLMSQRGQMPICNPL